MKKYILICFLSISFVAAKAQTVEDGLVAFKWDFDRVVCDLKIGDTLRLMESKGHGFSFKKSGLGKVKLKDLNGVKPCVQHLKLFDIVLKVEDSVKIKYILKIKIDGHVFFFKGENHSGGMTFIRIE